PGLVPLPYDLPDVGTVPWLADDGRGPGEAIEAHLPGTGRRLGFVARSPPTTTATSASSAAATSMPSPSSPDLPRASQQPPSG
ncbi:MAG: hypothetical protein ACRD0D_09585, partial [Acidimicrobiales bacterium]